MRDSLIAMLNHVGGEDNASERERMLSRRAACLEAELIHLEDAFARARSEGGAPPPDLLDLYSRLASGQRRCLEAIGLDRVPRDVTSLGEILSEGARRDE